MCVCVFARACACACSGLRFRLLFHRRLIYVLIICLSWKSTLVKQSSLQKIVTMIGHCMKRLTYRSCMLICENTSPLYLLSFQIRNGLGRFEMPKRSFLHSFDAFGKLSSWRFPGNGSAYFSTRYVCSDTSRKFPYTQTLNSCQSSR